MGLDQTEIPSSPALILNSQILFLSPEKLERSSGRVHGGPSRRLRDVEPYRFVGGATSESTSGGTGSGGGEAFNSILPTAQNDLTAGAYGELSTKLSSAYPLHLARGRSLYCDLSRANSATDPVHQARQVPAFDPRITVRYAMTQNVSWISAIGMAHQASNIPFPIPALEFSQLGRGLQTAYQASEGVEAKLPWGFSSTATAYLHSLAGLAQLTNNCPENAPASCVDTTVHGRSYGFELLVRRSLTERLSGWLSYTLSRSERDSFDGSTGAWGHRLSEFYCPHVVNLIAAYDSAPIGGRGARVVAYSGWPMAPTTPDGTPNARMPAFYRLDIRLEKKWPKSWGHVSFIAEWLNVLLSKEDIGTTCTGSAGGQMTCTPEAIGPITVPTRRGDRVLKSSELSRGGRVPRTTETLRGQFNARFPRQVGLDRACGRSWSWRRLPALLFSRRVRTATRLGGALGPRRARTHPWVRTPRAEPWTAPRERPSRVHWPHRSYRPHRESRHL